MKLYWMAWRWPLFTVIVNQVKASSCRSWLLYLSVLQELNSFVSYLSLLIHNINKGEEDGEGGGAEEGQSAFVRAES